MRQGTVHFVGSQTNLNVANAYFSSDGSDFEASSGYDALLESILFLARFFGRSVEADQIVGDVPLPSGRITEAELTECAGRAGLAITPANVPIQRIKSSMLPAIVVSPLGDALVVLDRQGDRFECSVPQAAGSRWIAVEDLLREHPGQWFLVRPVFYFDARSLLYHLKEPQRWFWDVFRANRWIYGWALVATVFINLLASVIPFYSMAVYDRVVPNNALDSLWVLTIAAIAVSLFDLLMKVLRGYFLESAARRADITLSSRIFAQSLRLRAASRPASGGVLANIVRDFESVREFFTATTLTFLGDLPFAFFFLALVGLIGGWLVLVPLGVIPIALGMSLLLQRPLLMFLNENMQENSQRTAHLFEVMNGLDTIKTLGAEAWARRKWEMLCVKISEENVRMREVTAFGAYFSTMLVSLETVLLVMFGAMMIAAGDLTMGKLIACSMLASRAVSPVAQIAGLVLRWQQTKIALEALNKIMEGPTDDKPGNLHLPSLKGSIEFRDVQFAYPDCPPLIKRLTMKIRPGERVGFIGRVGSGKSTILKLILNLYEPSQGTVLVDGLAVSQVDPHSLRRHVGYVPQDVTLFHGDIRENILMGAIHSNDEDLLEAIRLACLNETLVQLPLGVNTQVGERGERLSGGQRQCVAIARALVRQPKVLLMDEPTSMMDPATEQQLINNLKSELTGTTLLLVTHRMSMLPLVDRLTVVDQGSILLDGPRDEVLMRLKSGNVATEIKS